MTAFWRSMAGLVFLVMTFGIVAATILTLAIARFPVRHPIILSVFAVCILALAYAIARISTKALRDLASAAVRLGGDIESTPLPETGPTEVRDAAVAFNGMQDRIRRDVRERTYMLAAITHDLQTPMTRLRLRLEKVADEALRAKLIDDLAAMRTTVREGLDLARSVDAREPLRVVDLDSLLSSVCEDAHEAGQDVTLEGTTSASVRCSPNALRRCVTNVIDNAIAYGGFARVTVAAGERRAIVHVNDGGPGIPEEHLDRVFDPFFRLESSRSRDTGGTGLGLTIARNIAMRCGGDITVANHPNGGLDVVLTLPLQP